MSPLTAVSWAQRKGRLPREGSLFCCHLAISQVWEFTLPLLTGAVFNTSCKLCFSCAQIVYGIRAFT